MIRKAAREEQECVCPVCDELCDTVYVNTWDGNKIVGCDSCISIRDAWDELFDDGYYEEV